MLTHTHTQTTQQRKMAPTAALPDPTKLYKQPSSARLAIVLNFPLLPHSLPHPQFNPTATKLANKDKANTATFFKKSLILARLKFISGSRKA